MMTRILLALFSIACCAIPPRLAADQADGPQQQAYLAHQVEFLQKKLTLTDDQTAKLKSAMEAVVHGTATQTVAQAMQTICTPAQLAAWRELVLDSDRSYAASRAAYQTDEVDKTTPLTAQQKAQVENAFFQIEMSDKRFRLGASMGQEMEAHLADMAAARENALKQILTPEQLQKRTQVAQSRFSKPLPDLPALSLSATISPDRNNWPKSAP
jgi:hypothetical protein